MSEEFSGHIMFKERCWIIYGFWIGPFVIGRLKYLSEGETYSVDFDWQKGLSKYVLGWFHTHPESVSLSPSHEDQKTMKSWVRTLERPLICGIMYDNRKKKDFLWRNCYLFKRWPDKNVYYQPIMKDKLFKNFYIGKI